MRRKQQEEWMRDVAASQRNVVSGHSLERCKVLAKHNLLQEAS
jgi:hypothetical protein